MQSFPDRSVMYKYGSAFYGLMFVVTYPAFYHFSAHGVNWSLARTALHSLVTSCIVCPHSPIRGSFGEIYCQVWVLMEAFKQLIGPLAPRGGLRPQE